MPCGDQRIAHTKYFPSINKASYFHNHIRLYDHINNKTCDHDMIMMNSPEREKDNEQSKSVGDCWAMAMVHKNFIRANLVSYHNHTYHSLIHGLS